MATRSTSLNPPHGWDNFRRSPAVEALVWEVLATWHYMNPTATTSIWESESGATFTLALDGEGAVVEAVAGAVEPPDDDLVALCDRLRRGFEIA